MFTKRVQRRFDDVVILRVHREIAQRIDNTVVVTRAECRDSTRSKFQIRLTARDAEDHGRDCLAAVATEQRQRRALATHGLRRTRLEPIGRSHDSALYVRLKQRLEDHDLEFAWIILVDGRAVVRRPKTNCGRCGHAHELTALSRHRHVHRWHGNRRRIDRRLFD